MRPLCAAPSPRPAPAIIPQRSHPRVRPLDQCEPPAPARPHTDLCQAQPIPGPHNTPAGRHAPTPQNRHPRFRYFRCCVFACALKSGIYVSCAPSAIPRHRRARAFWLRARARMINLRARERANARASAQMRAHLVNSRSGDVHVARPKVGILTYLLLGNNQFAWLLPRRHVASTRER